MTQTTPDSVVYCGYAAVVGRPNVGKSTLINHLLGEKVNITSRKPQTTRHKLIGIKTTDRAQTLYIDTPGIHGREVKAINRYMNRAAKSAIRDVDVILFVVDRTEWQDDDQIVASVVEHVDTKLVIVVNKVDLLKDKSSLLPYLEKLQSRFPDADIVPVSAKRGENLEALERLVVSHLPEGPFLFPDEQLTDRSERFLVAEIVREKLMRLLGDELPYELTVELERFDHTGKLINVDAAVLVERDGQKAILIGRGGEKIKRVGTDARKDIEALLGCKVMLRLWVKTKSGWSDDDRALKSLGYDDT